MGNIAELLPIKDEHIKSSNIWGLPYGKTDAGTADKFLETIVQYVGASKPAGVLSELPDYVKRFLRQSPQHPALGKGWAKSFIGMTKPWLMPKIEIGDQYKYLKPPGIPVKEETIKEELKLQCSIAIETHQWLKHYIDKDQRDKLINLLNGSIRSAINYTVLEFFELFWTLLMLGISFDNPTLYPYLIKATENDAGKTQGLLKKYQEDMETFAKVIKKEAEKFKNYVWYDSAAFANYTNKGDNQYTVIQVQKPNDLTTQAKVIKALYVDSQKRALISREQSLYALLSMIKKTIYDLTRVKPSAENHIKYDPSKGIAAADEMWLCKVEPERLIVVMSHWDYIDLSGELYIDAKTGRRTMTLSEATKGATVIPIDGLPPGFAYIGDDEIFNLIVSLDHSGQIEHLREEEVQWITNYWFYFGSYSYIAGKVVAPGKNYNPGGAFFARYCKKVNEA